MSGRTPVAATTSSPSMAGAQDHTEIVYRRDRCRSHKANSIAGEYFCHPLAHFDAETALQRHRLGSDQRGCHTTAGQTRRRRTTDQAGSHHDRSLRIQRGHLQCHGVAERPRVQGQCAASRLVRPPEGRSAPRHHGRTHPRHQSRGRHGRLWRSRLASRPDKTSLLSGDLASDGAGSSVRIRTGMFGCLVRNVSAALTFAGPLLTAMNPGATTLAGLAGPVRTARHRLVTFAVIARQCTNPGESMRVDAGWPLPGVPG